MPNAMPHARLRPAREEKNPLGFVSSPAFCPLNLHSNSGALYYYYYSCYYDVARFSVLLCLFVSSSICLISSLAVD